MYWEAFVTCAITGAGDTTGTSEHVPVTPEEIALGCRRGNGGSGDLRHPRP